jgi:hypothetical protein
VVGRRDRMCVFGEVGWMYCVVVRFSAERWAMDEEETVWLRKSYDVRIRLQC